MSTTLEDLIQDWSKYARELDRARHVLIVDDDDTNRLIFTNVLESEGFVCSSAADGESAVQAFLDSPPDALLIDKNLPDTTGPDLIRRIQQFDSDCEAVLITAYANLESIFDAIELRAVGYLRKPLDDIAVLPATFERAIKRRRRRLQVRRMLADLRHAVRSRAGSEDSSSLEKIRREVDAFKASTMNRRRVLMSRADSVDLVQCVTRLRRAGFEIIVEDSAELALQRCSRSLLQVAIVSDAYGDMDGLTFFEKLRDLHGCPEVLFVAGHTGLDSAIEALTEGASAYFIRPISDRDTFSLAARRACDDHHERMYHYKLVTELHQVLLDLETRAPKSERRPTVDVVLGEFDVDTARMAIKTGEFSPIIEPQQKP